jgi:anti-anti-sigma factor
MLESRFRSMCNPDDASAASQEPLFPSAPPDDVSSAVSPSAGELLVRPVDAPVPSTAGDADVPVAPLSVAVTILPGSAHLALSGELDVFTSPRLAAAIDATLAQGPAGITFDLGRLHFLDAAGLRAITSAVDGVAAHHGVVRVRNASPLARRLFHIVGLNSLVHLDDEPAVGRDADRSGHDADFDALVEGIGWVPTRPAPQIVDEAMHSLVTLVGAVIADVQAVSVTLRREEQLATVAADGALGRELDGVQYDDREGPCVEAALEGAQVVGRMPDDGGRWPRFAAASEAHDVRGVVSTPIIVASEPAGAVNIYLQRQRIRDDDHVLPQLFAAHAAMMLVGMGAAADEGHTRDAFLVALAERDRLGRAEGALMERLGISVDDAHAELRQRAIARGTTLRDEVEAVLGETQRQRPPPSGGRSNDAEWRTPTP